MIDLRPYQHNCVDAVIAAARAGQDHQLIVMATGLGKTVVFVELARRAAGRSLIVAHREELITQAVEKLTAAGVDANDIGVVKAGRNETDRRYTVASVPTLSRPQRLKQLPRDSFSLLVIDEAHHSAADSYLRILDHFQTKLVLGVTATPDRLDGKGLADLFGPKPVFIYETRAAIRDGWLVNVRQYAIRSNVDLTGIRTRCGDFVVGELSGAVNTHLRNQLIVNNWTAMAYGRPTVAFCVDVQHALDLEAEFTRQQFRAASVHAQTPADERRNILARLRTGELDVVTNVGVLTEGWDCPPVSCIIMARPTRSCALYQQCVGRGLRPHHGKPDCLILDMADNCQRHKLATIKVLLGTQTDDFKGCTHDEVEQRESEQARKRIAAGSNDWTAEEVSAFLPLMLENYEAREVWHDYPATDKQIGALAKCGYDLGDHRPTRGECSFLYCQAREKRRTGPPTPRQTRFLQQHGIDSNGHSLETASRLIGELKAEVAR